MGKQALFFVVGLILLFSSCGDSYFFKEKFVAKNGEWSQHEIPEFHVAIPDTNRIFNLHLDISHSTDYAYENCYVFIKTTTPKGEQLSKRINIDFADKAGQWYGRCSGKTCNLRINLQPSAFFDKAGKYTFAFEQYMREDPLRGIKSLTFIVEDTGLRR